MIFRPGISHAWPRRQDDWQALALAGCALFAGFLLVQAAVLRHLFDLVAVSLAATAAALLRLAGYDILRTGMELRDRVTDHAIVVTSACDGHGLLISTAAAFLWLRSRTAELRPLLHILAAIIGAILLFNLIRILALFLSLGAADVAYIQHLFVAPLLSVLLVAGLALHARKLDAAAVIRSPVAWLVIALAAAIAWYMIALPAACAVAVPLANALLELLPGRLTETITCAAADPAVTTTAVLSANPLTVLTMAFAPADFMLAAPLVLATLALGRRPARIVIAALLSLGLFSLAMVLGATTMSHDQAIASGVSLLAGKAFMQSYSPPGEFLLALLKAAQNTLVHFNLFLLPLVLAGFVGAAPRKPSPAPPSHRRHKAESKRPRRK